MLLAGVFLLKPFDHLFSVRNDFQEEQNPHFNPPPPPPGNNRFSPDLSRPGIDRPHMRPNQNPGKEGGNWRRGKPRFDIVSIFLYFFTIAMGIALESARKWRLSEQRMSQAEAERTKAELYMLKAQINPHFLFNTLNNIYGLAVTQHNETAASILRLSNMLRYLTEETTSDFVPLEEEINCMKDYIELQKLRLGKKMTVHFDTVVSNQQFPVPQQKTRGGCPPPCCPFSLA